MKKVLLTTCNAKYIHKNLALRWLYTTAPHKECVTIREYTIKEQEEWIAQDILSVQRRWYASAAIYGISS